LIVYETTCNKKYLDTVVIMTILFWA